MIIDLKHVLLLPDGNRRYAIKNKISYRESYDIYFSKILEFSKYLLLDLNIQEVSVAALYYYNFAGTTKRLAIDDFFDAGVLGLPNFAKDRDLEKSEVTINVFGQHENLFNYRNDYREVLSETSCRRGNKKILNLLFCYSGQKELEGILKRLLIKNNRVPTYEDLTSLMFSKNEIGMIITCGQIDYEGQPYPYSTTCMPFLNAYRAKFCAIPKLLPEIELKDIKLGVEGYRQIVETVSKRVYPEDPTKDFVFV
ncbi:MAG: hypothetical protein UT34_C0001G0448 [candidate division WS6 bacterium GW2011_GWF2_39_15]|uniref:Uncharacterized protein n=1 Tax=candidate division WS6 bacterium GW2011_GWF2_39_15 TaxID=1619100 RepID=A0A0G0MTB3_9BACT|nr:MAG: hypothetical protein UT34_C0001G0448 [candidate division WS6 bacterium GW2011_GWF2_39_15]